MEVHLYDEKDAQSFPDALESRQLFEQMFQKKTIYHVKYFVAEVRKQLHLVLFNHTSQSTQLNVKRKFDKTLNDESLIKAAGHFFGIQGKGKPDLDFDSFTLGIGYNNNKVVNEQEIKEIVREAFKAVLDGLADS